MRKEKAILFSVAMLIGVFLIVPCGVFAAEPNVPARRSLLDEFHNPTDWLEMGADARFHMIWAKNIDSLSDDLPNNRENHWNYLRYRMRWWQKVKLDEDVDFNTRLVWEFRHWDEAPDRSQHVDFDEILFDQFNFTWRNMFDMPLTGVFGRQDIILGAGWLVLEGTPLDDSRTICFDALRFTYDWAEKDTTIDMIYIDQGAAEDRWLKPINDRDRHFTEQDEHGLILYFTNKSLKDTQLEGYFIYKNDNPIDMTSKDEPAAWPSAVWSKKAEIYTVGGAISGKLDDRWSYRAEGAVQRGDKELPARVAMADLEAYGFNSRLNYDFQDERSNNLHIGYEYLSGDDPSSGTYEQFDPLWGEYARLSELFAYSYNLETMIGEATNLHRFNVGHSFKPWAKWQIETDYHLLWADQNTGKTAQYAYPWYEVVPNSGFQTSSHSDFRGHLFTLWVKWACTNRLNLHWLTEYLSPGSYYSQGNRDGAFFLRLGVEYTF